MSGQKRDFDQAAATWDEEPRRVRLAGDVVQAMTRAIPFTPEMDVLDFGCGTGLVTLGLAPLVRSITGADTSQGMLDVLAAKAASRGLANVRALFLRTDEILTGEYDAIVSSMTLHHVEHVAPFLAQCRGALKPGGRLAVADLDLEQGEFHHDNTGVYHFGFDRLALQRLFVEAGFVRVEVGAAAAVTRPGRTGELRTFGIFLAVGVNGAA